MTIMVFARRLLVPFGLLLALLRIFYLSASEPDSQIPFDPKITSGRLENGLVYFIRQNKKPENRAELRLAVKAGSVLEDEDQLGVAHFVEHMAFNGTRNFQKQELVEYLESIGMKFGADINAYTSFDESVYSLQIPTDNAEAIQKAMQMLEDWAHSITLDPEEIEKERPVIIEEWRTGRGAATRLLEKQLPVLLKGSRYSERIPIGKKEMIETFSRETLMRFYRDWYRPDLMAVVAVGDFDPTTIEKLIRAHFSTLSNPVPSRKREQFSVPMHREPRFAIASDAENPYNMLALIYKSERREWVTEAHQRDRFKEYLFFQMLNQRFEERARGADPPFVVAFAGRQNFVGPIEALSLSAIVKEGGIEAGLSALLDEARRVELYGFSSSELEVSKANTLRSLQRQYENQDKTESTTFAQQCLNYFLLEEPLSPIEWDYQFGQRELGAITLEEINLIAKTGLKGENHVVLVSAPQKPGVEVPAEKALSAIVAASQSRQLKPYEDQTSKEPLLSSPPKPGSLTQEKKIEELEITEWELSNGMRVQLKPTDFKNDEVLFEAWSPGGSSVVSDEDFVSAEYADELVEESGVGSFSAIQLEKMLAGKVVSLTPYISFYHEGFSGSTSPKDLESALQLVYLSFVAPRMDTIAFISYLSNEKAILQNRSASPSVQFADELSRILTQNHFRTRPRSPELQKEINEQKAFQIYKERFANAGDFTFAFVGDFQLETMKPLILTYLGSLPSLKRKEHWRDLNILPPEGSIEREFPLESEPKSQVNLIFHGPFEQSPENRLRMVVLKELLNIKLRETLREKLGGVYTVRVSVDVQHVPRDRYRLTIHFGCAPERVEELTKTVLSEIEVVKEKGPAEGDLAKVREIMRKERETNLKENRFWLSVMESADQNQQDVRNLLRFEAMLKDLNPDKIRETARLHFNIKRYLKAVLLPKTIAK